MHPVYKCRLHRCNPSVDAEPLVEALDDYFKMYVSSKEDTEDFEVRCCTYISPRVYTHAHTHTTYLDIYVYM